MRMPKICMPVVGAGALGLLAVLSACVPEVTETVPDDGSTGTGPGAGAGGGGGGNPSTVTLDTAPTLGGGADCALILDASNVYWSLGDELRRVPKSGGAGAVLATMERISRIAQDADHVYWTSYSDDTIERVDKEGQNPPAVLTTYVSSPQGVVVDGGTLYWIDDQLMTMPASGGTIPTVFSPDAYAHSALAADATRLYWYGGGGLVAQAMNGQGTPTTVARTEVPFMIAVDETWVFYSTNNSAEGGKVHSVIMEGGSQNVLATGAIGPLAIDATHVYFVTGAMGPSNSHRVMRVHKASANPEPVAEISNIFAASYRCIAADDLFLYWVDGVSLIRFAK
jgi:hypothetical protein